MLFEKFIEQHRVHRLVAHAVRFTFFIPHHEVTIDFFHVLGHQAKLRDAHGVQLRSAASPTAVLKLPLVLPKSALTPWAVLLSPEMSLKERTVTVGRVGSAGGVAIERVKTSGRIVFGFRVEIER
jgi:hypothetical protein